MADTQALAAMTHPMTDASPEEVIARLLLQIDARISASSIIYALDAAGYEIVPKGTADNARLLDSVDDLRAYAARVNDDKMMRELMAIYSRITAAMIAASQEGKK